MTFRSTIAEVNVVRTVNHSHLDVIAYCTLTLMGITEFRETYLRMHEVLGTAVDTRILDRDTDAIYEYDSSHGYLACQGFYFLPASKKATNVAVIDPDSDLSWLTKNYGVTFSVALCLKGDPDTTGGFSFDFYILGSPKNAIGRVYYLGNIDDTAQAILFGSPVANVAGWDAYVLMDCENDHIFTKLDLLGAKFKRCQYLTEDYLRSNISENLHSAIFTDPNVPWSSFATSCSTLHWRELK